MTGNTAKNRIQYTRKAPDQSGRTVGTIAPHHKGEDVLSLGKTGKVDAHLVSLLQPTSMEAERYRRLRHAVENRCHSDSGTVIALSSPGAGDGKTITSINLAGALAQDPYASVLLIEMDLRQPFTNVKNYLGLGNIQGPGVTDKLTQTQLGWDKTVHYITDFNLYFMTAGQPVDYPYEILKTSRLGDLLQEARNRYDYIILDTPPVVLMPDVQLVEKWVDGVLMVVAADTTPRRMLAEALNYMNPDKVLGLVFNGHSDNRDGYGDYEYNYSNFNRRWRFNQGTIARLLARIGGAG